MNHLHLYPTSRALRRVSLQHKTLEGFLPSLMRIDEFEQRVVLLEDRVQVDRLQRILLLREATHFEHFEQLHFDRSLVQFFTKSEALFKFFEELALEGVGFEQLGEADAYAEFGTHLEILQQLRDNYITLLDAKGLSDKLLLPTHYQLNEGFLRHYTEIDLHLEGYLSHYELELFMRIATHIPLSVHYTTSPFNLKMQERFEAVGIVLPPHHHTTFSLQEKRVVYAIPNEAKIEATLYAVEEREEQVAVAFEAIETMVQEGIAPDKIALILPDESFKEHFMLFDHHNNLNFAMGYDYHHTPIYRALETLYLHWQQPTEPEPKARLAYYGVEVSRIAPLHAGSRVAIAPFFNAIDSLGLHEASLIGGERKGQTHEGVEERYRHFTQILHTYTLTLKEWLFLWLKALGEITQDDVRGGLVTVMGVLETRGVAFEGVVIVDFNEGRIPATSSKDQFLNSQVRAFANLPTKLDREALQKQYYKRLLEQADKSVILYTTTDNLLPSKFLYELGVKSAISRTAPLELLYAQPSKLQWMEDPIVEAFDARATTWSASRLKVFLECKRKYYYRYIQKIPTKVQEELNEGAHLHMILNHLFDPIDHYTTQSQMHQALEKLLDRMHPYQGAKASYEKQLWLAKLEGFIQKQIEHFEAGWRVVVREEEYQTTIGGLTFKGRIDRIDQNATETLVIDYKSGRVAKEPRTLNPDMVTDFQMAIYHQMLKGRFQTIKMAYLKLFDGGGMQDVGLLEAYDSLLFETIIQLKQTTRFVAKRCESLQKCTFCEFALLCERGVYL